MSEQPIRPISRIWIDRLTAVGIPTDGTVAEVAPGHEPKIGTALALLGFVGTIVLIEPDTNAATAIQAIYKQMLPNATVSLVGKRLQDVQAGTDIPGSIDALVANHAFDDMVMSCLLGLTPYLSDEPYPSLMPVDYSRGTKATVLAWKTAIETLTPASLIVSQYPVRILSQPGCEARQTSGFEVLDQLKIIYRRYASQSGSLGGSDYKDDPRWREDPRWWLTARFRPTGTTDARSPH
jgi:hypothetical protein